MSGYHNQNSRFGKNTRHVLFASLILWNVTARGTVGGHGLAAKMVSVPIALFSEAVSGCPMCSTKSNEQKKANYE